MNTGEAGSCPFGTRAAGDLPQKTRGIQERYCYRRTEPQLSQTWDGEQMVPNGRRWIEGFQ